MLPELLQQFNHGLHRLSDFAIGVFYLHRGNSPTMERQPNSRNSYGQLHSKGNVFRRKASSSQATASACGLKVAAGEYTDRQTNPQNSARSESWRLRSPPPTPPPLVSTLPNVEVLAGFRPMFV